MPIEGIIAGLKECAEKHDDDGVLGMYVKDAIEVLTQVETHMDESYQAGKFDQLQEDYRTALTHLRGGVK